MTAVRRSITASAPSRDAYLAGVRALAAEPTGVGTGDVNRLLGPRLAGFRIFGLDQPLMTWDLFVLWHYIAMSQPTTPPRPLRNRAHGGPVFLPWHRMFLLRLEQQLQRVTTAETGLPYWDWTAGPGGVLGSGVGAALGPARGDVASGPLADVRVRLAGFQGQLWSVAPRPLRRASGRDVASLPTRADVAWALGDTSDGAYDTTPWDATTGAFRNRLEGWEDPAGGSAPQLHNRVHVWVGGDMSPGTSPNDPVFYLNHGNVDRLWEAWMTRHGRSYLPSGSERDAPQGHRLQDTMLTLLGQAQRPADVLDAATWYSYDSLSP